MQNLRAANSSTRDLSVTIATSQSLIEQAQRIRFEIFSQEYGANLIHANQLDQDQFDEHCLHLVVIDNHTNAIVATTRILTDEGARKAGMFYSETEFNIEKLKNAPGRIMEIGRTCVAEAYRNGATLSLLWSGIGKLLLQERFDYLIGCGSVSLLDGGIKAWSITQHLKNLHLAQDKFHALPKRALPRLTNTKPAIVDTSEIPALIKAYMRLGAKVCGDPCWDPEFKCADLLILLEVKNMTPRYKKHFLKHTG